MAEHTRYGTKIDDGTLFVEGTTGEWLEVGTMSDVTDLVGETYTIEYTNRQAAAAWIDTDEDNTITVDVRERVAEMTFDGEFVDELESASPTETVQAGHPERTERFAALLTDALQSAGKDAQGDAE